MRVSEQWLREWIDPPVDTRELAEQLTLLGLEVDDIEPAAPAFTEVQVVRIASIAPHPDADRLRVCQVERGEGEPVPVVCGAPNARAGLVTVLANVGGKLPGDLKIKRAKLRGVESFGMLCSARELGLSEQHEGILELPDAAPLGQSVRDYLALDDNTLVVELTPDRGDCLSVLGVARELSARNDTALTPPDMPQIPATSEARFPVQVEPETACVRYAGRVIRGADMQRVTPVWMVERLRRAGVRAINPAVDVTNYVMLELGQPMHAFDLVSLHEKIHVRQANAGESVELLDGRTVAMQADTTLICDAHGPIAIAGIMGGAASGVTRKTSDVFLEAALFLPERIIGKPRRYNALTESSHRFERGVDPDGQVRALERATELLLAITGGEPGPVDDWREPAREPRGEPVLLRRTRLDRLLGVAVDSTEVASILQRLGVSVVPADEGWQLSPPGHRYDLRIEEDFIEEIARVHGYDRLPRTLPAHHPSFHSHSETTVSQREIRQRLVDAGYREVVTYSFVEASRLQMLRPELPALALSNSLSNELAVMRTTLIGSLIDVWRHNAARQQHALRLFETGLRFVPVPADASLDTLDRWLSLAHGDDLQIGDDLVQQSVVAGLAVGRVAPEGWASAGKPFGFFEMKGDLEDLFARANAAPVRFVPSDLAMLHPGQQAAVEADGVPVGYVGCLNPALAGPLDIPGTPVVFELSAAALRQARFVSAARVSRFPQVRRDLAFVVDEAVSHEALLEALQAAAPDWLQQIVTFDVYQGERLEKGKKSIALGLILQAFSRTLEDAEVEAGVQRMVAHTEQALQASLRN